MGKATRRHLSCVTVYNSRRYIICLFRKANDKITEFINSWQCLTLIKNKCRRIDYMDNEIAVDDIDRVCLIEQTLCQGLFITLYGPPPIGLSLGVERTVVLALF